MGFDLGYPESILEDEVGLCGTSISTDLASKISIRPFIWIAM